MCSNPVTRFTISREQPVKIDQPQFLPVLYFINETEYATDQFDESQAVYIRTVRCHTNFECSIRSIWEFKNPRIDPVQL